jgi:hypothetical protein
MKKRKKINRLKETLMKISLSLITIILFLIILEVILRFSYFPISQISYIDEHLGTTGCYKISEDTDLVYEQLPSCGFNSFGMRDYEYSIKKPDNTFRILIVGDSFTFGSGVYRGEDTYPKILERKLNNLSISCKFEVLNGGMPGYNTVQEVRFFEKKGLPLDLDEVIMAYVPGDKAQAKIEKSEKGFKIIYYRTDYCIIPH